MQVAQQGMEARLQRLHGRLFHRRVLAPLVARLEDDLADEAPVRLLAGLCLGEGHQSLEQRLAPRVVLPAQLGLTREVRLAGLVGPLRRLLERLPLRCGVVPRAPVQGPPFVAQAADPLRQFLR